MSYHTIMRHTSWGDRGQKNNRRTRSRPRSPQTDFRQSGHFQRWLESLGKPPLQPNRHKFEYVFKIAGVRYIKFPGEKITLTIRPMLSVMERNQLIDYELGEKSYYTAACEILQVEGPGIKNKKTAAIMSVKILYIRRGQFVFDLPEKYQGNKEIPGQIFLPGENAILRILVDPQKTADPSYEGIMLSYGSINMLTNKKIEKAQYIPPTYLPLLARVQSSDLQIGHLPT